MGVKSRDVNSICSTSKQ